MNTNYLGFVLGGALLVFLAGLSFRKSKL